jgi:hypothetical protein
LPTVVLPLPDTPMTMVTLPAFVDWFMKKVLVLWKAGCVVRSETMKKDTSLPMYKL